VWLVGCVAAARCRRRRGHYDARVIDDARLEAIDDAVRVRMQRGRIPGLTLGLTDRDAALLIRSYGYAELASRQPVTSDTLFEIGSIGKTFTAVAILQLVDEGRLDLHAPVDTYLPWFAVPQRAGHAPITIAHLLSHTAGIVAGIDGTPEAAFQVWSLRDLPTFSAPGERFHYSNVGYKGLGLVLETVEGRPYREIIRAHVLDPLEMSATEPVITHDIRPRIAAGYEYLHDDRLSHAGSPLAPATWLETETADGSIASTAADMCVFGDQPWLVFAAAPDGFDTEQPLIPSDDGTFRVSDDPGNPETLRFDTVIDGRALRAWLSGWPYYRAD
jgi:D-alanyl-D-alanine carboxypeptidase